MNTPSLRPDLHKAQIALNALPIGSVVLDRFGHAWQSAGHSRDWYRAYGDDSAMSSWELAQQAPLTLMKVDGVLGQNKPGAAAKPRLEGKIEA